MDRNFLYVVVAFLGIAIGVTYTQKTNPDFFANIIGQKQVDSWRNEDPGWKKDSFPTAPVSPPVTPPAEPKVEPTPPPQQPRTEPQPQQPRRRIFPNGPSCPGCRPG